MYLDTQHVLVATATATTWLSLAKFLSLLRPVLDGLQNTLVVWWWCSCVLNHLAHLRSQQYIYIVYRLFIHIHYGGLNYDRIRISSWHKQENAIRFEPLCLQHIFGFPLYGKTIVSSPSSEWTFFFRSLERAGLAFVLRAFKDSSALAH